MENSGAIERLNLLRALTPLLCQSHRDKCFLEMSSVSRHTFSKLFQLRTGHGVLGKYFRTRGINERDHNCECGQLETVEHVLKECPLHPAERDLLRKVSPELDPKILLDTKKGLGAVVKLFFHHPTSLLMVRLIKQLVKVLLGVESLVLSYWVLCIYSFP